MKWFLFFLLLCSVPLSAKTADEIIAQARSFVGSEEALDAIQALRFVGVLDPADPDAPEMGIDLLIEKPAKQRLVVTGADGTTTSIVGSSQGYILQNNFETGQESFQVMPFQQIRSLRANTVENLYFFDPPQRFQVRTKYMGDEEIDGRLSHVLKFSHRGGLAYVRYFDVETGELIATEADTGFMNMEVGQQEVDGLKFSESVEAYLDGELVHTIRFSEIEVNPEIPEGAFSVE